MSIDLVQVSPVLECLVVSFMSLADTGWSSRISGLFSHIIYPSCHDYVGNCFIRNTGKSLALGGRWRLYRQRSHVFTLQQMSVDKNVRLWKLSETIILCAVRYRLRFPSDVFDTEYILQICFTCVLYCWSANTLYRCIHRVRIMCFSFVQSLAFHHYHFPYSV